MSCIDAKYSSSRSAISLVGIWEDGRKREDSRGPSTSASSSSTLIAPAGRKEEFHVQGW